MDEKIKISISKDTLEVLQKDCADFKILKENGTPNQNAFINALVVNYYETFSASEETLHEELKSALENVPEYYREKAFLGVVKVLAKNSEDTTNKKNTVTFSFKPTKTSQKAVLHIQRILLSTESLSSFYRRMFTSYAQKTKNEREKIIHKENYDLLQKALSRNTKVCLQLHSGTIINDVSIYSVSASKDELFNYVLGYNGKQNVTVRLASVKHVAPLPFTAFIPEENVELFKRQIVCGAQYPMYNTDNQPIRVQLTPQGKALFDKVYLYRPTPESIDGDIYTFNCSAKQILYYFERFGSEALILSPKKLGVFMRNYYHFAAKKYKALYHGK